MPLFHGTTTCYNQLLCQIVMAWTSRDDKLSIRVEKGTKPRLKTDRFQQEVVVTVPADTFVNWPPAKVELKGGYTLTVQKMQQQYKISVQHMHEKKPEIVLYSSPLTHDADIRTHLKELSTRVNQVSIAGPNLEVKGVLSAQKLTLESTTGAMHVNSKIICDRLTINGQNIAITPEALLSCSVFKANCRKIQLDGRIYPLETADSKSLTVEMNAHLVHLGVDGCIGESNEKDSVYHKKHTTHVKCDVMKVTIFGSLANYGKITATDSIDINVAGSIVSLADGTFDSAGRGYNALKNIRGVRASSSCAPSSSQMRSAILDQDTSAAAQLIENGVDLNDKVNRNRQTLRQTAAKMYKDKVQQSTQNRIREKITLINALFSVHNWRRGSISAQSIHAVVGKNCEDCAQFNAHQLALKVGGSGTVEADSIWNCTWVEVDVGQCFRIEGQVKHRTLILNAVNSILTAKDAILSCEIFARLSCESFDCDGIWTIGENFTLEVGATAIFRENAHVEAETLELTSGGELSIEGSWQIGSCTCNVERKVIISATGKIFIEDSFSLFAQSIYSYGFCNVTDVCEMQLRESAHFFSNSKLESNALRLICEAYCTLGGTWIADVMEVYTRADLITTCTGKVAVFDKVSVTTGAFRNDSTWQIEKDFQLTVGQMEQSEDGTLFVKQNLEIIVHAESLESWAGRIVASRLSMRCLKKCQYDGYVRANDVEVYLPYEHESQLIATGQWDILCGSLSLKGNSKVIIDTEPHPFPAFILSGRLNAAAIIGPFVAFQISDDAIAQLTTISSNHIDTPFDILVSVGWLTTGRGSIISSLCHDTDAEGIIVAQTWYHRGQIRFNAETVLLLAGSWINFGRLTNVETKENHMKTCYATVDNVLHNNATIACGYLELVGTGVLENAGRIFAADTMHIKMSNFNNDEGVIESREQMHLLTASKEWTKLSGSIKARRGLDLSAHKLQVAVKDAKSLCRDERLSFSARCDLVLATPVHDEQRRLALGCAARRSIVLDSNIEVDRCEFLLGGSSSDGPVTLHLREECRLTSNTVMINGEARELHLIIDGGISCNRITVSKGFHKVIISGKGQIEIGTLLAKESELFFDIFQLITIGDITAQTVSVVKDSIFRAQPTSNGDVTSISCARFYSEGTVFVEARLIIEQIGTSDLVVNGLFIGSSLDSELSLEGARTILSGQIANFKFLEIYARERCTLSKTKIKNIRGVAIDAGEFDMNGEFEACNDCVINCTNASVTGNARASPSSTFSLFSTGLRSNMSFISFQKVSFAARCNAKICGKFQFIEAVDIDAKWLMSNAAYGSCRDLSFKSWNSHLQGKLEAEKVAITSLGVIMNAAVIASTTAKVVAPFILSTPWPLPNDTEVHCIFLASNSPRHPGASYLHLAFEESLLETKLNSSEANNWKDTAVLVKDRFNSATMDVDEILLGLKYMSDLTPTRIELDNNCDLLKRFEKVYQKFEKCPIGVFSLVELVSIINSGQKMFAVVPGNNKSPKKNNQKNRDCLYELLTTFRSARYESESTRVQSETDGGYASRSSSEDLDSRSPKHGSPSPPPSPLLFQANHLIRLREESEKSPTPDERITDINITAIAEEDEELAEFEELEHEIEEAQLGHIRMDYIICRDQRIFLAKLKQRAVQCSFISKRPQLPIMRVPSSNDLVMKRQQVKHTMSTLDLKSFGSESSLNSLDFTLQGGLGSPMQFSTTAFQRTRIPRGSFLSPRKASQLAI